MVTFYSYTIYIGELNDHVFIRKIIYHDLLIQLFFNLNVFVLWKPSSGGTSILFSNGEPTTTMETL